MASGHCPWEREAGPIFLAADVGPSRMQPIISLYDFGGLGAKIITPSFSPLQFPQA
jgi:hypothetical protein